MMTARSRPRAAALQAEVVALRVTVSDLQATMQALRTELAASHRQTATAPGDRLAWSVLAGLPERRLLDPRSDRQVDLRDPAASPAVTLPDYDGLRAVG